MKIRKINVTITPFICAVISLAGTFTALSLMYFVSRALFTGIVTLIGINVYTCSEDVMWLGTALIMLMATVSICASACRLERKKAVPLYANVDNRRIGLNMVEQEAA